MLINHLSAGSTDQCDIFEKPLVNGWILRKYAHAQIGSSPGKGCYWMSMSLIQAQSNFCLKQPGWEWADLHGTSICSGRVRVPLDRLAHRLRPGRSPAAARLQPHDLRMPLGPRLIPCPLRNHPFSTFLCSAECRRSLAPSSASPSIGERPISAPCTSRYWPSA